MHQMLSPALYDTDSGIAIRCKLKIGSFDASGATAKLHVANQDVRDMSFDDVDTATYVTVPDDFGVGKHQAQVRLTKGAVTMNSEIFFIPVLGSA